MKFFKKASTSSPPPTQINEEIPKKNLFQLIKQFFHFNRLEMKFLWWIFLASMFWSVYLISPLSKPKAIYVYGNRQVEVETIREQAGIKKGKTIWGILSEHETIQERLTKRNPKIKDASVTLSGLNTIQLTILENHSGRIPVNLWLASKDGNEIYSSRVNKKYFVDGSEKCLQELREKLGKNAIALSFKEKLILEQQNNNQNNLLWIILFLLNFFND